MNEDVNVPLDDSGVSLEPQDPAVSRPTQKDELPVLTHIS